MQRWKHLRRFINLEKPHIYTEEEEEEVRESEDEDD